MIKINSQLHVPTLPDYRETNDRLRALCAFDNPKYLEAKRQGRKAWYIEKLLLCYNETADFISYPAGMVQHLAGESISDETNSHRVVIPEPSFKLRSYQQEAVDTALCRRFGALIAGTGSGKSFMAMAVIHARKQRSIILVHTAELLSQWRSELAIVFNVDIDTIGKIGAGVWKIGELFTVGMMQTLARNLDKVRDLDLGFCVVDECHHVAADNTMLVMNNLNVKFRLGLTATIGRRDNLQGMIFAARGQISAEVKTADVLEVGGIVPAEIKTVVFNQKYQPESWGEFVDLLSNDDGRNKFIADIALAQTEPTLILCDRTAHCEALGALIDGCTVLHGKLRKSEREAGFKAIEAAQVTVGTSGLLSEGIDCKRWSILLLASPISSSIKLTQAIGRVLRSHPDKVSSAVIDIREPLGFSISSHKKRLAIYEELGHPVSDY